MSQLVVITALARHRAALGAAAVFAAAEAVVKAFVVVMGIFVIGAIALLLGGLLRRLEQWLLPWHGR